MTRLRQAAIRTGVGAVLPVVCFWARRQEASILARGIPLSPCELSVARTMGLAAPERVRLLRVEVVPPTNRLLRVIGGSLGIVTAGTIGMTLRYGIFIQSAYWGDRRLLVHELTHVLQYERVRGFSRFLWPYLQECISPGYPFGPLEQEAKRAEALY